MTTAAVSRADNSTSHPFDDLEREVGHVLRVDRLFALYERVGFRDPRTDDAVAPKFDRLIKKIESLLVVKGVV